MTTVACNPTSQGSYFLVFGPSYSYTLETGALTLALRFVVEFHLAKDTGGISHLGMTSHAARCLWHAWTST
eukprot:6202347-Pleurochrysis_carterae.AAC.1